MPDLGVLLEQLSDRLGVDFPLVLQVHLVANHYKGKCFWLPWIAALQELGHPRLDAGERLLNLRSTLALVIS